MIENSLGLIDAAGFVLAIVSLVLAIILVIRTEKELDMAAKSLLACSVIALVSNLTSANGYLVGVVSENVSQLVFHSSRFFSLVFFNAALYFLVKITREQK